LTTHDVAAPADNELKTTTLNDHFERSFSHVIGPLIAVCRHSLTHRPDSKRVSAASETPNDSVLEYYDYEVGE